MQFSMLALAGFAALASAQTFTGSKVSPTAAAPAGCATSYSGTFELSVMNATTSKAKRGEPLLITLTNGVLSDSEGRIGYIASNYQFQFDFGGQAGELYNSGFSICGNKSLALGGSAVWYECLSGTFYNLYDENWAPQCKACYLEAIPMSNNNAASGSASVLTGSASSTITSVTASTTTEAIVSSITDHQVQGATSSSTVVSSSTTMITVTPSPTPSTTSVAIITSISDHQIQGPTTTTAMSVTAYTGAAAMPTMAAQMLLAAAGAAVVLL